MGSLSDPIYIMVSTHTSSPDGTTRNDTYNMTANLNTYSAQLAANIATPVVKAVLADQIAAGTLSSADANLGTSAGGPVVLRCQISIGSQALATPARYHLVRQDMLSTPITTTNITIGGQVIYNWIDGLIQKMTPMNLYPGFITAT